jgi:hypothetical protein
LLDLARYPAVCVVSRLSEHTDKRAVATATDSQHGDREMRGGRRPGSGRKRSSTKVLTNFKLERSTIALLRELPRGQMTKFVEDAVLQAFKRQKRSSSL